MDARWRGINLCGPNGNCVGQDVQKSKLQTCPSGDHELLQGSMEDGGSSCQLGDEPLLEPGVQSQDSAASKGKFGRAFC
jgi:hypothetical protein